MRTRFAPTITSGNLHVGHLFNMYINLIYSSSDQMIVIMDYGDTKSEYIDKNIKIVKQLLPGKKIIKNADNQEILLKYLEDKIGKESVNCLPIYSQHFYLSIIDSMFNINMIIRGSDWATENDAKISLFVLKKITGYDNIDVFLHPIVTHHGNKISKSDNTNYELSLDYILNTANIHPLSCYMYVLTNISDFSIKTMLFDDIQYKRILYVPGSKPNNYKDFEFNIEELIKIDTIVQKMENKDIIYDRITKR